MQPVYHDFVLALASNGRNIQTDIQKIELSVKQKGA